MLIMKYLIMIYINPVILEDLIYSLKNIGYPINFECYISERYPTSDGLEVERIPLITKKKKLGDIRRNRKK